MLSYFFIYLLEASFYLILFSLAYRLFFCRLTYFQWNRWYLVSSLFLSLLIPFFPSISLLSNTGTFSPEAFHLNIKEIGNSLNLENSATTLPHDQTGTFSPIELVGIVILCLYLLGCLYKAWQLIQNLREVNKLIRSSFKVKEKGYYLIRLPENLPAFSFLRFIFLPKEGSHLSKEEVFQIFTHERVHVDQGHSFDLLLFEMAGIILWFNPCIYYFKLSIREVHEFIVDSTVIQQHGQVKKYGELLLKLAVQHVSGPIKNTFSNKQIIQRIKMLTQPKSSPMEKLKFLLSVPLLALALSLSSFFESNSTPSYTSPPHFPSSKEKSSAQDVIIRKISWLGNAAFSDEALNKALGLQKGDIYDAEELNNRLGFNPSGPDISALYMDNGYLFFSVDPKEVLLGNVVDLSFTISEGPQAKVRNVTIRGNKKIPAEKIRELITIQEGELFNRSKLIKSQNAIIQSGLFKPEAIQINPIPFQKAEEEGGEWLVDLEFIVEGK